VVLGVDGSRHSERALAWLTPSIDPGRSFDHANVETRGGTLMGNRWTVGACLSDTVPVE